VKYRTDGLCPMCLLRPTDRARGGYCGECKNVCNKAWYRTHKGQVAHSGRRLREQKKIELGLQRRHKKCGLSHEEQLLRFAAQGEHCAVCDMKLVLLGRIGQANTAHLDHNHATGLVREFLCSKCNRGLGMCDDESHRLQSAAQYLKKWSA
jgi:hypothetical protein